MSHRALAACASVVFLVTSSFPPAAVAQYEYVATTQAPKAAKEGPVRAGSLTWQCAGNRCTISGPWPAPGVAACKALAQVVGQLSSYGRSGAQLGSGQMAECNAGVPVPGTVAQATPIQSRSVPLETTRSRAAAPTQPQPVDVQGQVRSDAPIPTKPGPGVKAPSAARSNQDLQQEALDEKTKQAVKETTKSRVHAVGAEIDLLLPESPLPTIGAYSPVNAFCGGKSGFAVVRLRYEWRPTPAAGTVYRLRADGTPVGDPYIRDALLVVRRSDGEVSRPVELTPYGGVVEMGRATGPLTGLLSFSTADLCPSGCTDARLAPRTAAHANRFDQRWQRACLRR